MRVVTYSVIQEAALHCDNENFWRKLMIAAADTIRFHPDLQTAAVCLAAVQGHGMALKYVEHQSEPPCRVAIAYMAEKEPRVTLAEEMPEENKEGNGP